MANAISFIWALECEALSDNSLRPELRELIVSALVACSPTVGEAQLPYERVRTFDITGEEGYHYWCKMIWHNYAGAQAAGDSEALESDTANDRHDWITWATADGRYQRLLELVESGIAQQHGESRMRAESRKRAGLDVL